MGGRSGGLPALSGVRAGTAGKQKVGEEVRDIFGLERGIPKSALTLKKRECCPCRVCQQAGYPVPNGFQRRPGLWVLRQPQRRPRHPAPGKRQPTATRPHSLRAGGQGPGLWGGLKGVLDTCSASTKPYEVSVAGT